MAISNTPSPLSNIIAAKTYNAAWFSGSTKELQITAAIAAAATDGALYVYVPANMLPYTAASVTFNTTIRMICEGGDPSSIDVRAYGADSTGVLDSTVAMQVAHNTGLIVHYPSGTYRFSSITGINSGGIIGDGPGNTILISTDVTAGACIKFTGRLPVGGINNANGISNISTFRDFILCGATAKVAGAGIQVSPPAGESSDLFFENIVFQTLPICIDFVAASLWRVVGCIFNGATVAGIQVSNTNSQDSGDVFVIGCIFQGAIGVSGPCILYKSAAGLKVEGCKMNGGTYGLLVQWTGTGSGDLVFWGNSVENMSVSGVRLTRVAAAVFHNIQIIGNEFSLCTDTITSDVASAILTLSISGNIISQNVAGTTTGITLNGVTGLNIEGNIFRGNGGTPVGINLTSCTGVDIGINTWIGITTNTIITTCTSLIDHNVYFGSTVTVTATYTTAFALPATPGFWEVYTYIAAAGVGGAATARFGTDGTSLYRIGGENGASVQLIATGLNVQVWQNTGVGQTVNWEYRRVA